jgi:PAS domain S-box-containing protein
MEYDSSHLASLFEHANEGFVATARNGEIVLVNPAACRMFDFAENELLGQKIELLIPRESREHHVKLRDDFYKSPSNRVMGHGRDLHGVKKNGVKFPVEVSLSVYTHKDQTFVMAFIVDITQRKSIEQKILQQQKELQKITEQLRMLNEDLEMKVEERTVILREALQNLEQSQLELKEALDKERLLNEMKSSFVSMASHEFRTPLTTILSSTALLSKYTQTEQQLQREKHIGKIRDSVKHLNNLLDDFLSLGRLEEGKVAANITRFSLKELVQDTVEEMRRLTKPGQEIISEHVGNEEIESDKNMLKNILLNLSSNAIKFSDSGKNIHVHTNVTNMRVKITVRDEGMGIPREDFEHLFTSFFRSRNAQNIQGTGLGLHIVKRYTDLLHGSIDMQSELNKGTTVTIFIPAKYD